MDEFYIGYEPEMPDGLARTIRLVGAGIAVFAIALAGAVVALQARFSDAVFEYGVVRTFEGRLIETPFPALEVAGQDGASRWLWLVGPGKRGAAPYVRGLDGRRVRVSGSLIERDGDVMIQIEPARLTTLSATRADIPPMRAVGWRTVRGEIVDSKCHLGVMKPGEGPTHRDCAVRCLLGGVPPMLAVHDGIDARRVVLVAADATAFALALPSLAGRPVAVSGMLFTRGPQQFLAFSLPAIVVVHSSDTVFRLPRLLPKLTPGFQE